jgi:membrane-associated phospholipid phosphatase
MLRSVALALALSQLPPFAASGGAQTRPDSTPIAPALRSDTVPPCLPRSAAGHTIRWYEPLAVIGGIALLSPLDEPIANHFRDHRSQTAQDVADAWKQVGTVGVGVVTAGIVAGGLIAHDNEVTRTGLRLAFSAALAGAAAEGIKVVLGRERPFQNTSAFDFDPLHFDTSFPSGHSTLAFAMAASLADDIHRTWATVGLYGVATGVAVTRVYEQDHWLTDVLSGAALGVVSAKLVNGRWRVFGLHPPRFLVASRGPVVGWSVAFRE